MPGALRNDMPPPVIIRPGDDPLDVMLIDHMRQRLFCAEIERFAAFAAIEADAARRIGAHLTVDLPRHHADEDEDLFPRLRRRAEPEDEVDRAIKRLTADHTLSDAAGARIAAALGRALAGGPPPTEAERDAMRGFAEAERRHLVFENAVILPLARARLTDDDRAAMLAAMAARRGTAFAPTA
jgi:hypothetical protein